MKVAFITSTFPSPDKPSLGIFNLRAAKALSLHCNITVYKLRMWKPGRPFKSEDTYEGLKVRTYALPLFLSNSIWGYIFSSYITYYFLRKSIGREKYDVLFSSGIDYGGLLSAMIARKTGTKHVAQVIGSDVNFSLPQLKKLGFDRVYNKGVHGIIAVCNDLRKRVAELLPDIKQTGVAYRGIDLKKFVASPLPDEQGTQFLFLGGFPGGKGDDGINLKGGITLTDLWKANEHAFHNLHFRLVIGGVNSNDEWLEKWKASLQYPDAVTIAGVVKTERAQELIKQSHIVLLPSLAEGLPNIAVESAALGRVVIGSKVNGVPEIILHEKTGFTLEPLDKEAWLNAMLTLGPDKAKLQQMGTAAREHVTHHFDSEQFAPAIMNMFKLVVKTSN